MILPQTRIFWPTEAGVAAVDPNPSFEPTEEGLDYLRNPQLAEEAARARRQARRLTQLHRGASSKSSDRSYSSDWSEEPA